MQERRVQDWRDKGKEGCRKVGFSQDWKDSELEGYRKGGRKGEMQERRDAG